MKKWFKELEGFLLKYNGVISLVAYLILFISLFLYAPTEPSISLSKVFSLFGLFVAFSAFLVVFTVLVVFLAFVFNVFRYRRR